MGSFPNSVARGIFYKRGLVCRTQYIMHIIGTRRRVLRIFLSFAFIIIFYFPEYYIHKILNVYVCVCIHIPYDTHTHTTLCFVSALVTLEIDNNSSTALTCVQFDYLHYRLPRNTNTRAHAELFLSYRRSTRHSKRSFPTFRYLKCYD